VQGSAQRTFDLNTTFSKTVDTPVSVAASTVSKAESKILQEDINNLNYIFT
jgi:hypothetical protein